MDKIKVGTKIKVKGDYTDFTDHLDGKTLTVTHTAGDNPDLDDDVVMAFDGRDNWYIQLKNIVEVIE